MSVQGRWLLPWNMALQRCTRHPKYLHQPCAVCTFNWGSYERWFSGGHLNTHLQRLYQGGECAGVWVPLWGKETENELATGVNPFAEQQVTSSLQNPGGSVGLVTSGPVNILPAGQQSAAAIHDLPGPSGGRSTGANTGSPPDGVTFSDVKLYVGNFLGKSHSIDVGGLRFLPAIWYKIWIQKGVQGNWREVSIPNIIALDILVTCSDSPGRSIYLFKKHRPGHAESVSKLGEEELGMSVCRLIADAEAEGGLCLRVLD